MKTSALYAAIFIVLFIPMRILYLFKEFRFESSRSQKVVYVPYNFTFKSAVNENLRPTMVLKTSRPNFSVFEQISGSFNAFNYEVIFNWRFWVRVQLDKVFSKLAYDHLEGTATFIDFQNPSLKFCIQTSVGCVMFDRIEEKADLPIEEIEKYLRVSQFGLSPDLCVDRICDDLSSKALLHEEVNFKKEADSKRYAWVAEVNAYVPRTYEKSGALIEKYQFLMFDLYFNFNIDEVSIRDFLFESDHPRALNEDIVAGLYWLCGAFADVSVSNTLLEDVAKKFIAQADQLTTFDAFQCISKRKASKLAVALLESKMKFWARRQCIAGRGELFKAKKFCHLMSLFSEGMEMTDYQSLIMYGPEAFLYPGFPLKSDHRWLSDVPLVVKIGFVRFFKEVLNNGETDGAWEIKSILGNPAVSSIFLVDLFRIRNPEAFAKWSRVNIGGPKSEYGRKREILRKDMLKQLQAGLL